MTLRPLIITFVLLLAGCDIPGMGPDPRAVQREADGRAIGGACRHALRGIEDCYLLNEKASKTAIFAGWKDMDQYMRDNNIQGQAPELEREAKVEKAEKEPPAETKKPAAASAKEKTAEAKPKSTEKTSEKSAEKVAAKPKPAEKPEAATEKR